MPKSSTVAGGATATSNPDVVVSTTDPATLPVVFNLLIWTAVAVLLPLSLWEFGTGRPVVSRSGRNQPSTLATRVRSAGGVLIVLWIARLLLLPEPTELDFPLFVPVAAVLLAGLWLEQRSSGPERR